MADSRAKPRPLSWFTVPSSEGGAGKTLPQVCAGLKHSVYTPTLTGLGERSHSLAAMPTLETFIEDVAQVLRFEDLDDVILVGHSFAGSIGPMAVET